MAQGTNMQLCFDPDLHPNDTLSAFTDFIQTFELRYEATYPDPPKVSMDAAIQRWALTQRPEPAEQQQQTEVKPTVDQYDQIRAEWRAKDMVVNFLGLYSSKGMYSDWLLAQPVETQRRNADWNTFTDRLKSYYKPTENVTLKHYQFRSLTQERNETFSAFSIRVAKEAKFCTFKCEHDDCKADEVAIRDQIVIGLLNDEIRQEALRNSWSLNDLRTNGMRIESASRGAAEISGDTSVNRMGKYSNKYPRAKQKKVNCYFCGSMISTLLIVKHAQQCPARSSKCTSCGKDGHYAKCCKSKAAIKELSKQDKVEKEKHGEDKEQEDEEDTIYNINIFRISEQSEKIGNDFKVQMIINNSMDKLLADTGAKISVCGINDAKKWNIYDRMVPTKIKIKPYNSKPIEVVGTSRCSVTFGNRSVPIQWHVIQDKCEPILAGKAAEQLGIIKFSPEPDVLFPVNMIQKNKEEIQEIVQEYNDVFQGIGKLKTHQVKIHYDRNTKPIAEPARTTPYHLQERVDKIITDMLEQDIIEEHPKNEPALWTSNIVIVPKPDGDLRITLDARNVNKVITSSNTPIPRHEDIKAKLAGAKVFSKMDLKSAFWQLELHPESRHLTTFHGGNGKLYRQKRLSMGIKSAQAELNAAMAPLFANIQHVHLIHDDLIIATEDFNEHNMVLKRTLQILFEAGLTLNPKKCVFGAKEISFWGLIISDEGIRPDPAKVEALKYMSPPRNKKELLSFLCMMQSHADFIPNFSQKASTLRELTKKNAKFKWENRHQRCFENLLDSFTDKSLLQFFDLKKGTYVIIDAHQTGLGAILAQGNSLQDAKPVVFASRTTSETEQRYPQIDLEATALDFALRRFRNYVVGAPNSIQIVTDHKPLCSIFNGSKTGSVRTERIKLRNQDIRYVVNYQRGNLNQSDYLSRHARPLDTLPTEERKEADELNNLLYTLHITPIIDCIGLSTIAKETSNDETLSKLRKYIQEGKQWIPKGQSEKLNKFKNIMSEITVTGNGVLFKGERIILPATIQPKAIELAHQGAHPGQSGLIRRLRYHFFFHNMYKQVKEFTQKCNDCNGFVDKKTSEPLQHHKVPETSWSTVAVDLFGPMPTSKHVVVVYDLASRFPTAKLVSSTKADKVIPALQDIYDSYGYPEKQISDNGPPFNSKKMEKFAIQNDIEIQTVPPHHPNSNPAETFMRPLGKALKIGHQNNHPEQETIREAVNSYRQTPHPSTGITPAVMMFRDGLKMNFPRKKLGEKEVIEARKKDLEQKRLTEDEINQSKYRKASEFKVGDLVLVRNFKRQRKFDRVFEQYPYVITDINDMGNKVTIEGDNGVVVCRHPDDIKPYYGEPIIEKDMRLCPTTKQNVMLIPYDYEDEYYECPFVRNDNQGLNWNGAENTVRRSERIRQQNRRYFNEEFVTDD